MKDCSLTIGKHFEICVIEVLFEWTNLQENRDMILVATISKQIIRCYILSHHVWSIEIFDFHVIILWFLMMHFPSFHFLTKWVSKRRCRTFTENSTFVLLFHLPLMSKVVLTPQERCHCYRWCECFKSHILIGFLGKTTDEYSNYDHLYCTILYFTAAAKYHWIIQDGFQKEGK